MEWLTAAASFKLGQSALKLAGAAVKAAHKGELADLFELAGGTIEFAGGLTEAQRATVAAMAAKVQKRLEWGYQMILEREGADWALRADVQAVFPRLADVLGAALPDAQAIVAANLDTARVAALVADKAAKADSQFAKDQIGRRILVELVTAAYDEVKQDRKFADALSIPIGRQLLGRAERIEDLIRQMTSRIGAETGGRAGAGPDRGPSACQGFRVSRTARAAGSADQRRSAGPGASPRGGRFDRSRQL